MLITFSQLNGSTIKAVDGEIGKVKDVYFDDRYWTIRFMVVDIHPWLPLSEQTLISPISLLEFNIEESFIKVSMTKEMVKDSPRVDEEETVSREFEKKYFDYYGYGYYWMGNEPWGEFTSPTPLTTPDPALLEEIEEIEKNKTANHLRSAQEIFHYGIGELDGKKGYIKDFIWDTQRWSLRFVVVDTRDWLPGGKNVLIKPNQISALNWQEKTATCQLTIEQVKACPEYCPDKLSDPQYLQQIDK
jgi:hypothetical protein